MHQFKELITRKITELRPRLMDTSRRNALINNSLTSRSASFIRIVDEKPQNVFNDIAIKGSSLKLVPLPSLETDPLDERNKEFTDAFAAAMETDEDYLESIDEIDTDNDDMAFEKQAIAERELKDRVREILGYTERVLSGEPTSLASHARNHGINPSFSLPDSKFIADDDRHEDDELQTLLLHQALDARLGRIRSRYKTMAEEKGLKTLYLSIGFLRWNDPSSSDKKNSYKSPLVLLPIELDASRSAEGTEYQVKLRDDPIINPVLKHKLFTELGVELTEPENLNATFDIEEYFNKLSNTKSSNLEWRIDREIVLGVYPFQGMELYNDLDADNIDFSTFDILCQLLSGTDSSGNEPKLSPFTDDDIESPEAENLVPNIVLDADSSQYLALVKAASGQNLAIEGPPGSGKSQTIVNLIANSINSGKKVLFVAQKGTALDVVLSRLTSLNLESLVLPLMGRKGDKVEFYDALKTRVDVLGKSSSASYQHKKAKESFNNEREKLSRYVRCLERKIYPTDITVHQVLGLVVKNRSNIDDLPSTIFRANIDLDLLGIRGIDSIQSFSEQAGYWQQQLEYNSVKENTFWARLDERKKDFRELDNIASKVSQIKKNLDHLPSHIQFIDYIFPIDSDLLSDTQSALEYLLDKDTDASVISEIPDTTFELISDLSGIFEQQNEISERYNQSWDALTKLHIQKDAILSLFELCEKFQLKNINVDQLSSAVENKQKESAAFRTAMKVRNEIEEKFGFLLTVPETKLLARLSRDHELLRKKQFLSIIKDNGFNAIDLAAKRAKSLLKSADESIEILCSQTSNSDFDSEFIRTKLPPRKTLTHLVNVISSSNMMSFLSSEYRDTKRTIKEIFGLSKFHKLTIINNINDLIDIYKQWDSSEINDVFGNFNKPKIMREIKELEEKSSNMISLIEQHIPKFQLESGSLSSKISADLLNYFDDYKYSFVSIKTKMNWDDIKSVVDRQNVNLEALEEQLNLAKKTIPMLLDIEITQTKTLNNLIKDFSLVKSLAENQSKIIKDIRSQTNTTKNIPINCLQDTNAIKKVRYLTDKIPTKNEQLETNVLINDLVDLKNFKESILELYDSCSNFGIKHELPKYFDEFVDFIRNTLEDNEGPNKIIQTSIVKEEIEKKGLKQIVEALENSNIELNLEQQLTAVIVRHLSNKIYDNYGEILSEFSGNRIETIKEQFKSSDRKLIDLAKKELLQNALSSAKPPQGKGKGPKLSWTDMSLINYQLGLKRRISPSKMVKRSIKAMMELHPCWMMVPTSVASFLPRKELFDIVIIDEASQMTPEQSISALMRAKQAVIVGDTNQLPPTNFFRSNFGQVGSDDEEEDDEIIEESILELANSSFRPKHRLLWHYRSRHEALIAFSNHYIYDNELVIFPSPGGPRKKMGVDLIRVDGIYSKGLNPSEASRVVDDIVEFMETDINRSLGVVTMNQSQMELIEASVIRQSQSNSKVRAYIEKWNTEDEGLQKFFVKNIENVQGDERDVIYISTVYGKDSLGKFRQSFGPINNVAGKRRLNVLFSRAKEKIRTFTSIPLDMLNPGEHNEGAILLKRWLEYSATGTLGESLNLSARAEFGPDSPFEEHVIECIESIGYIACPQVGVSNYFIDIGVRHPDYDLGYLCGVECDGASYHSSKSARDRDILRQEVLERLGWDIYRIWSTDWFRDSRGQTERLKEYLDKKLAAKLKDAPIREAMDNIEPAETETSENIGGETENSPVEIKETVRLGSKVCLEYFDGPRAGLRSKFILVDNLNHTSAHEGFDLLPITSPLGEQVNGEEEGSIVSFEAGGKTIDVEIVEICA
jgi:superfamily I DNA and/or RNA helicase